ncbi:hypothetical protein NLM24_12835 [Nocardia zapadnayensis]|uniref:hypothetical protein n=1 Tax=Nocardia rhamnosiphila TaxID=426716 RepID=UPI002246460C|nr:hypothetical protein [Nocardia zapadnayensis]MCX0271576.1 hypothetical protein [Nocardia zapadnayensis]
MTDGVADFVRVGGSVVFGAVVVVGGVDVVVGDTVVVDTSGDVDVVVELAGIEVVVPVGTVVVVVVVLVGAVVVGTVVVAGSDVTVIVDGSADTVTVVGSAVTVTVGVSVGVMVTVTVDIEVEVTVPGSGAPAVASTERLIVAEKLALIDASVEFAAGVSVVMAVVDSVAVAVPVPGSAESAVGRAVPVSVAVSGPATSPGTETALGAPEVVLGFVTPVRLRTARWSKAWMAHAPELFGRTGGFESARTMTVIPIAVVTNAATTPARDTCRRKRSADGPAACRPPHRRIRGRGGSASMSGSAGVSSLLSPVCIQLLLSPSRCADRWEPVTTLRTTWPVKSVTDQTVCTTRKEARVPEHRIPAVPPNAEERAVRCRLTEQFDEASVSQVFTEKSSAQTSGIRTSTAIYRH